jgi:hypothetical protein
MGIGVYSEYRRKFVMRLEDIQRLEHSKLAEFVV